MTKRLQPPQEQKRQPGRERSMRPRPDYEPLVAGSGRLRDKVALVTGGDSGIGRAVALAMAREGAHISFAYLDEHDDASETERLIAKEGAKALKCTGDIGDEEVCKTIVERTVGQFGRIDILQPNGATCETTTRSSKRI